MIKWHNSGPDTRILLDYFIDKYFTDQNKQPKGETRWGDPLVENTKAMFLLPIDEVEYILLQNDVIFSNISIKKHNAFKHIEAEKPFKLSIFLAYI